MMHSREGVLVALPEVLLLEGLQVELGRHLGAVVPALYVERLKVLLDVVRRQIFSHQIRRVVRPVDLDNLQRLVSHFLLKPEILHLDMAQFAQPLSVDYAQCCTGVSVDDCVHIGAQVPRQRYEAKRLRCAFGQSVKL